MYYTNKTSHVCTLIFDCHAIIGWKLFVFVIPLLIRLPVHLDTFFSTTVNRSANETQYVYVEPLFSATHVRNARNMGAYDTDVNIRALSLS